MDVGRRPKSCVDVMSNKITPERHGNQTPLIQAISQPASPLAEIFWLKSKQVIIRATGGYKVK
jgi:hypothetical protein